MSTPFTPIFGGEIEGGSGKNGIMTINVPFFVATLREAAFWLPDNIEDQFGLPYLRRTFKQQWGNSRALEAGAADGAYLLTLTLEGVDSPSVDPTGVEFDCDGTLGQDDIAQHPDIGFLMDKYSGHLDDAQRGIIFDQTLTNAGGDSVRNPLFGQDSYSVPSLLWTRSYCTTAPDASITRRLGLIDTPPPAPDGYLPALTGVRNWIKVVGKPTFRGNVWQVVESWQISPRGGFPTDVYRQ